MSNYNFWTKIATYPIDDLAGYLIGGRKAQQLLADTWLFSRVGDEDEPTRILDFGCALGRNTFSLGQYSPAWNVVGFDCAEMLARVPEYMALKKFDTMPNVYFTSDWEVLKQDKFDVALAILTFQHIFEYDLICYLTDLSKMTKRIIVNGRRFNDDNNKNTWDIMTKCGWQAESPAFTVFGDPNEHSCVSFRFEG